MKTSIGVAVLLLLVACGQAPPDSVGTAVFAAAEWRGPDGEPAARGQGSERSFEVQSHSGPEHCDWTEAVFLSVGWPLGTSPRTSDDMRQYIRDEQNVVSGARYPGTFDKDAELPQDAQFSGYRTENVELWFGPDIGDTVAYLRLADRVEQWPRTAEIVACA